jgi:hypothetical protein
MLRTKTIDAVLYAMLLMTRRMVSIAVKSDVRMGLPDTESRILGESFDGFASEDDLKGMARILFPRWLG